MAVSCFHNLKQTNVSTCLLTRPGGTFHHLTRTSATPPLPRTTEDLRVGLGAGSESQQFSSIQYRKESVAGHMFQRGHSFPVVPCVSISSRVIQYQEAPPTVVWWKKSSQRFNTCLGPLPWQWTCLRTPFSSWCVCVCV